MKKIFLLGILSILIGTTCYSQDTIVRNNGNKIIGKIYEEDSTAIYITIKKNNKEFDTYIDKSDISSISYFNKQNQTENKIDKFSVGLGLGNDYGGIGLNLLIYPQKNIGLFVGSGYAFVGIGLNVGTKLRLRSITDHSGSSFTPYGLIMYGYHAAISVKNAEQYNKLFYGPTFGIGLDTKLNTARYTFWSFTVLIPIFSSEMNEYIEDLEHHGVEFKNKLNPIALSLGCRFDLDNLLQHTTRNHK